LFLGKIFNVKPTDIEIMQKESYLREIIQNSRPEAKISPRSKRISMIETSLEIPASNRSRRSKIFYFL
jgi:hypothetical protein